LLPPDSHSMVEMHQIRFRNLAPDPAGGELIVLPQIP